MPEIQPLTADVVLVGGMPRLRVGGELTTGNLFFVNGDTIGQSRAIYDSEIRHAAAGGIHRYSTITNLRFDCPPGLQAHDQEVLRSIIEADDKAQILLRVSMVQGTAPAVPEGEYMVLGGERQPIVSIASDRWFEAACARLRALAAAIRESSDLAPHLIGYHLEWFEWMQPRFYEYVDTSEANCRGFRAFLRERYADDAALQAAWGGEDTLANACVPSDIPMDDAAHSLLTREGDRRYTDYLDYMGVLTSSRIEGFARVLKEVTDGQNVVLAFYGYYFEIYHASAGHFAFRRLLASPWLDGFVSPTSYIDRNRDKSALTAASGYMTAVESVVRAGKLWIMESDERTFINRFDYPQDETSYPPLRSVEEISRVHRRETGLAMIHGTSLYPMDLIGCGWYDDEAIWQHFGRLDAAALAWENSRPAPPRFDVALVVDERANAVTGCSRMSARSLSGSLQAMYRVGVRFALVELQDLLQGRETDCRFYLFVDPYRLSGEDTQVLCRLLHQKGRTAVFLNGFGRTAPEDVQRLTGMRLQTQERFADHSLTAVAEGYLDEESFAMWPITCVEEGCTRLLGRYADGGAAFAVHEEEGWRAVFCGAPGLSVHNLRRLMAESGVPVLCDSDDVLSADDTMVMLSACTAGVKQVTFDRAVDVYDYFAGAWHEKTSTLTLGEMTPGEVKWLFYGDRPAIEARGLPRW